MITCQKVETVDGVYFYRRWNGQVLYENKISFANSLFNKIVVNNVKDLFVFNLNLKWEDGAPFYSRKNFKSQRTFYNNIKDLFVLLAKNIS
jgi:hypothetical protein